MTLCHRGGGSLSVSGDSLFNESGGGKPFLGSDSLAMLPISLSLYLLLDVLLEGLLGGLPFSRCFGFTLPSCDHPLLKRHAKCVSVFSCLTVFVNVARLALHDALINVVWRSNRLTEFLIGRADPNFLSQDALGDLLTEASNEPITPNCHVALDTRRTATCASRWYGRSARRPPRKAPRW